MLSLIFVMIGGVLGTMITGWVLYILEIKRMDRDLREWKRKRVKHLTKRLDMIISEIERK